jgi:putative oxidoreductase
MGQRCVYEIHRIVLDPSPPDVMKNYLPTLGRVLLAIIFLLSGIGKIADFGGTQQYMAQYGMPLTAVLLVGAILFEVGGGLSLLLGWKVRYGAFALILFLIPATLIFHTDFAERAQMINFLKNLAIMGGLLALAAAGPGPLSVGGREPATQRSASS